MTEREQAIADKLESIVDIIDRLEEDNINMDDDFSEFLQDVAIDWLHKIGKCPVVGCDRNGIVT